jgi:ankyrin repeat protein
LIYYQLLIIGEEEFPTLLHFASRYGFERLLWTLLECPAACEALNVRNVHGMTPIDQAKTHGHDVIVNNLQSFLDVLVRVSFKIIHFNYAILTINVHCSQYLKSKRQNRTQI